MKMKLHSLRIKDELRGRVATNPQYLAYSVVTNDQILSSPTSVDLQASQSLSLLAEEEDIFRDALPEFTLAPDISMQSHNLENSEAEAEALLFNQDLGKGRASSSEIFYEALGSDNSDFVSVSFMTNDPSSPEYDGIDTQVRFSSLSIFSGQKL